MFVYQNYHKHSWFTNPRISDSTVNYEDYAKRAVELGHGILSSCEHGYQGRYIEAYEVAKKYGLKFLESVEAYQVNDRFEKDRTNCHIFIGAKNERGRRALNNVMSEANDTGFYGQARLDKELILSLPPDDVWVTSACIKFWDYEDVEDFVAALFGHFGRNFYLEVQYHNTESQRELNKRIIRIHRESGIPLIMGCDSHYIYPKQAQDRTDYLVSKGLTYPQEEGWYLDYPDGDEAYRRFAEQCVLSDGEIREAIENTNVFLQVEEYDSPIFNKDIKMPSLYLDKSQEERDEIYKQLIRNGFKAYSKGIPPEKRKHYIDEIAKEVQTVIDTKTADYFIINHEVIKQGKKNGGHLTKSGRGSAVSFVTNMLLGFTEVDRIAASVKMYPERFMSTERILQSGSLPD